MIDANTPVKVYNHNVNDIGISGQFREYLLAGSRGIPTVLTMPFSDVEYVNSRSPVFRNGTLQFDPSIRDEIYKALYLDNWKDTVLFDEEIERIIRENDMDSAMKFLDVSDVFTIQRIRGHLVGLINDEETDISRRMIDLINGRYDEINRGIRHSKLDIGKAKDRMAQDDDPRFFAMADQIKSLQAAIAELLQKNEEQKSEATAKAADKSATKPSTRRTSKKNTASEATD